MGLALPRICQGDCEQLTQELRVSLCQVFILFRLGPAALARWRHCEQKPRAEAGGQRLLVQSASENLWLNCARDGAAGATNRERTALAGYAVHAQRPGAVELQPLRPIGV